MDDDLTYPAPTMSDPRPDDSRRRNKTPILAALVLLMMATIAGTSYLVLLQLHAPDTGKGGSALPPTITTIATTAPTTPTADLAIPANNGWTAVSEAGFGDVVEHEALAAATEQHGDRHSRLPTRPIACVCCAFTCAAAAGL